MIMSCQHTVQYCLWNVQTGSANLMEHCTQRPDNSSVLTVQRLWTSLKASNLIRGLQNQNHLFLSHTTWWLKFHKAFKHERMLPLCTGCFTTGETTVWVYIEIKFSLPAGLPSYKVMTSAVDKDHITRYWKRSELNKLWENRRKYYFKQVLFFPVSNMIWPTHMIRQEMSTQVNTTKWCTVLGNTSIAISPQQESPDWIFPVSYSNSLLHSRRSLSKWHPHAVRVQHTVSCCYSSNNCVVLITRLWYWSGCIVHK